jgi:hypothetical protein
MGNKRTLFLVIANKVAVRFCLIANQILNMNKKNKWDGWAASAGNGSGAELPRRDGALPSTGRGPVRDAQEPGPIPRITAAFRGDEQINP